MATNGYKMIGPDGAESQPFDSDALLVYARQGYIQPQTTIFDPTIGQWLPASGVAALQVMNAVPGTPPAAPAAPYSYGNYAGAAGGYAGAAGYAPKPQVMPRVAIIAIALVGVLIIGGVIVAVTKYIRLQGQAQTINSYDRQYAIRIPALWSRWPTQNPRVVEYLDRGDGTGVTLIKVTRTAPQPGELDRITEVSTVRSAVKLRSAGQMGSTIQLKVGTYDARQIEMDDGGVGLHFRMTYISTPTGIYRVGDFERKANVAGERPMMDRIVATFHPAQ